MLFFDTIKDISVFCSNKTVLSSHFKDKTRFIEAFEHINALLSDENRWPSVHEELTAAGVNYSMQQKFVTKFVFCHFLDKISDCLQCCY